MAESKPEGKDEIMQDFYTYLVKNYGPDETMKSIINDYIKE